MGWEGFVQQSPKTLADTGGINDDILRAPTFNKGFQLTKEGEVVAAGPLPAMDDTVFCVRAFETQLG